MKTNTELGVDLKTMLLSDARLRPGRQYAGIITRDLEPGAGPSIDPHFTFCQTATPSAGSGKRNPHIYVGRYITLTRRDDGSACLNFRTLPELGRELSVVEYAWCVQEEIVMALVRLGLERGKR